MRPNPHGKPHFLGSENVKVKLVLSQVLRSKLYCFFTLSFEAESITLNYHLRFHSKVDWLPFAYLNQKERHI